MMEYRYIGTTNNADEMTSVFKFRADNCFKKWLEYIIFSGQPHLAEYIKMESPDEETLILFEFCRFFSAVLRDEKPKLLKEDWDLSFEGRHHSLVCMYYNFINNIYNKDLG